MTAKYVDIDKSLIRNLSKRSNLWGFWLTFHVWAVIITAGLLFILWPNPFSFVLAVIIIGSRQHGLAILMHDAAHSALFEDRKINDFVGKWLLAAPYGGDLKAYRKYHLVHHKYTQTDRDPDLVLSNKFPVTKQSLIRKFLRDISGITFLRIQIATFRLRRGKDVSLKGTDAFEATSFWPTLITNAVILGTLTFAGCWWAYFALWLLPHMTVFWVVLRLRNIAEHAMTDHSDNPLTHARTTKTNWLTRSILSPYWVNYHVEHHAYMFVPCFNLPKLHKAFEGDGYDKKMDCKSGYIQVLKSVLVPA
ncbi:MAG: fatty acid desaturase family protein [Hellea sp.]|nr:fatty acid desaturase family protein [Hellea sp.]